MIDFILLTPSLSNRRGRLITLQLIVFIVLKSCVDTYATKEENKMSMGGLSSYIPKSPSSAIIS